MARIVLAEDDESLRTAVSLSLESAGHVVTALDSGVGVLEEVVRMDVDLLITDLAMPRMDGLQLLATLREHGATPPTIVVYGTAALPDDDPFMRARSLGALVTIPKPFRLAELLRAVERVLHPEPNDTA
jgi:CheY-like chemotaxis protein